MPLPTDPLTLPQQYHRWDYQDQAYLWQFLTAEQKASYRTLGNRRHTPAFAQWMKERLTTLPDIIGRWHLDELRGTSTPDSSHNANPGTVWGAIPTPGFIGNAFFYDGNDDLIQIPHQPIFNPTTAFSVEFRFQIRGAIDPPSDYRIVGKPVTGWWDPGICWNFDINWERIWFTMRNIANSARLSLTYDNLKGDTRYHVVGTWDGSFVRLFGNGALVDGPDAWSEIYLNTNAIGLGNATFPGILDEVIYYNRALDATEVFRHSLRRYP